MLLKNKRAERYAKAMKLSNGKFARFQFHSNKEAALLEGCISEICPSLPELQEEWEILPPSWETLTAGDRIETHSTLLVQAVHGIGDLAVVLMVDEKTLVATTPLTIAELKNGVYIPLPYDFIKPETVEVSGKTYRKADVEKALEGVKAVGK
ncbi:MAG: hypothetical protein M0R37_14955 [Bacteroidales bacterium]|jgi:hypothetical protein|nr:hypothetical protein [Bacteroidales bacterium]